MEDIHLDGYDILDHVIHQKKDVTRSLFWRAKRGTLVQKAVRDGDYKYIIRLDKDSVLFEKVFNLKNDLAEKKGLLKSDSNKIQELKYNFCCNGLEFSQ